MIGNDGWESVATDIVGIHDYDENTGRLGRRYGASEFAEMIKRERPAGRILSLTGHPQEQPVMITEFGGIAYARDPGRTWGYSRAASEAEFRKRYTELLEVVRSIPALAGFCYTQFADTYQEANGLLDANRVPKIPLEHIALATRGPRTQKDRQVEWMWREHLMNSQRHQYMVPSEDYQTTQENR